jgi:hypothetical protein
MPNDNLITEIMSRLTEVHGASGKGRAARPHTASSSMIRDRCSGSFVGILLRSGLKRRL